MAMRNSPPPFQENNMAFFSDGNVLKDIGKLEGRLDSLEKRVDGHEKFAEEITKLKEFRSMMLSGVAVISAIISALVTYFTK
nr:MAG TPA: Hemolysin [Caudoviricetes sp.]